MGHCYQQEQLGLLDAAIRCHRRALPYDKEGVAVHELVCVCVGWWWWWWSGAFSGAALTNTEHRHPACWYLARCFADPCTLLPAPARRPSCTSGWGSASRRLTTTGSTWSASIGRASRGRTRWRRSPSWPTFTRREGGLAGRGGTSGPLCIAPGAAFLAACQGCHERALSTGGMAAWAGLALLPLHHHAARSSPG